MKQHVAIKLQTMIDDQGEIEYNTVEQTGQFIQKDNLDVLVYKEVPEAGLEIRNLMSLQKDAVNIKRTGSITMNQKFMRHQKTETYYEHPHGRLHMETYTHNIVYEQVEAGEHQLNIDYTVKLNGMDPRKHTLSLTILKEDVI